MRNERQSKPSIDIGSRPTIILGHKHEIWHYPDGDTYTHEVLDDVAVFRRITLPEGSRKGSLMKIVPDGEASGPINAPDH